MTPVLQSHQFVRGGSDGRGVREMSSQALKAQPTYHEEWRGLKGEHSEPALSPRLVAFSFDFQEQGWEEPLWCHSSKYTPVRGGVMTSFLSHSLCLPGGPWGGEQQMGPYESLPH